MSWNVKYVLLMLTSIITTYICSILISNTKKYQFGIRVKKYIVVEGFTINLLILILFKYYNFFLDSINSILVTFSLPIISTQFNVLLPVGISFYTFQALGYIIDVYRGDVKAEKNFFKYALFVSFFPQLVAGPIERSKNLLSQIDRTPQCKIYQYKDVISGAILMLWGYFMKMVVADRAAILVNTVYDSYWLHGFFGLTIATCFFALQIYCDFASYSTIAMGAARILGFRLMENFKTPYLSRSVGEFWRRWHISLSTWLRDYLYIPLGGNRASEVRKNVSIAIVFTVSGLWHGASLHFVVWGMIWAFYLVLDNVTKKWRIMISEKFGIKQDCFSFHFGQCILIFILTCFAWIFFRAPSIMDALNIIKRIVIERDIWSFFNGTIYGLGLSRQEFNILLISVIVVFLVDLIRYKKNKSIDVFILEQNLWFQWIVVIAMILFIFTFGIYGVGFDPKQFIYFQF
jgi:D-alanyl-lipoteichoic acid acyltransferase DltB (MBOAT superfamily)